jgi:hypothetical protein
MVHDDAGVGLEGLEVVFGDERAVSDAGIALVARSSSGSGSSVWPAGWWCCAAIGRERRTRVAR